MMPKKRELYINECIRSKPLNSIFYFGSVGGLFSDMFKKKTDGNSK
jgi:hypothetical protein